MEAHTRPDADENAVIDVSFNVIEPLVKENEVELTISVIKMKQIGNKSKRWIHSKFSSVYYVNSEGSH
jgi:hypothetical protein